MKNLFTLCLSIFSLTSIFAQTNIGEDTDLLAFALISEDTELIPNYDVAPTSSFSYIEGATPGEMTFTSLSTNESAAWFWDFGDGNISTEKNPSHIFQTATIQTVCLTVSNAAGYHVQCMNILPKTEASVQKDNFEIIPESNGEFIQINIEEAGEFEASIIDINGQELVESTNLKMGDNTIFLGETPTDGFYIQIQNKATQEIIFKKITI